MKTIGVLGGLGPQATMDFEHRLHQVAQRLIPRRANSGYPPLLVHYCRHPPVLLNDDGSPKLPIEADPRLLEAAGRLGQWVDFLVITSNTPHLVQASIEQAAGRKVLSMIDVTLKEVRRRGWRKVGVLGLGNPIVYTKPLEALGIAYQTIDGDLRADLDTAIMQVMQGNNDEDSSHAARQAVAALRVSGVDGIILGCTEIPLMLPNIDEEESLINPAQLLAEAAVRQAMVS